MKSTKTPSCRHAFTKTITELAELDRRIYAVTSDARGSVTLTDFAEKLPEQFVEVGIAEQNASGISAGLALSGKTVFLCGPACFYSARSVEQIKNDIAYSNANVKVVGVSGGVSYGALGSTHHSLHDIALFRAIPGISVLLPADYTETVAATRYLAEHPGPVYMRLGRGAVPDLYETGEAPFELGKLNLLREGADCTILATGEALFHAIEAAKLLEKRGVSCTVADVHTVKPLDSEGIRSICADSRLVVTVEEHSVYGGLGGAVAELLSTTKPTPLRIVGFPDEFMPAGSSAELFELVGITAEGIAQEVMEGLA
ncbi:MAG: transketolase family protein [Alkalispirochaetaceae bacterium]